MDSPYQRLPNGDVLSPAKAEPNNERLPNSYVLLTQAEPNNDVGTDGTMISLQPINDRRGQVGKTNVRVFRALKVAIGVLLLVVVLFFTVLSKLTLISMTSRLNAALARDEPSDSDIVSLYWQLLFVIMVPQCITFLRTMMRGVCGKRTATFPWPTFRALLVVSAPSWSSCIVYVYGARWGGGGGGGGAT